MSPLEQRLRESLARDGRDPEAAPALIRKFCEAGAAVRHRLITPAQGQRQVNAWVAAVGKAVRQ